MRTTLTAPRRDEADLVILELVRLTLADSRTLPVAVKRLLAKGHSAGALRLAQSRILLARVEQRGAIADRAALTLAAALAESAAEVGAGDAGDR